MFALYKLALATGARLGELLALDKSLSDGGIRRTKEKKRSRKGTA
jgi:integrase